MNNEDDHSDFKELEVKNEMEIDKGEFAKTFIKSIENVSKALQNIDIFQEVLKKVFIIPVTKRPFFPGMVVALSVQKKSKIYEILKMISALESKYAGIVLTISENVDVDDIKGEDLYTIGVLAKVLKINSIDTETVQVVFGVERRIKINGNFDKNNYTTTNISYVDVVEDIPESKSKAYFVNIISIIKELIKFTPLFKEELKMLVGQSDFTSINKLADFAVSLTTATREGLQEILEEVDFTKRMQKVLVLLNQELQLVKIQNRINKKVEKTVNNNHNKFILKEQLKGLQEELQISGGKGSSYAEKFLERLKTCKVPKNVKEVIDEEMEKLQYVEEHSFEFPIIKNYLDWLTSLPWGVFSKDNFSTKVAEKILDRDHFGLKDVKERILEFISVGKLTNNIRGNIICIVGPPGVGKTSIAKGIAEALKRKVFRFSVGGMHDENEIKGHRRSYVGAMPGKLIQAIKYTKVSNPVIIIDEIDKIGNSYKGDPASTMLEVLDPEQNKEFIDYYLDVPYDLSNVLFILTANVLDSIPYTLLDRMEVIRVSGYILEDKLQIAKKFLIPKYRKKLGLSGYNVSFTMEALKNVIDKYAREAGVRSFEKQIIKILRKIAKEIVGNDEKEIVEKKKYKITPKELDKYLGKPLYISDAFYKYPPIGVSIGLAWTAHGGTILYIECVSVKSDKTEMKLTGQAGDVMKESAQIAWTYLQSSLKKYTDKDFFKKSHVHIHIPEGATPKDGPSAGITLATSLLSLLTNTKVKKDMAMTGEITLTGKVLPVGGIKDKLIAARRSKLKTVIIPKENAKEYEELPQNIKNDLSIIFVEHYDEVVFAAFPTIKRKSDERYV